MVMPSTATLSDGKVVSRVAPYLQPGSGVVITRGDVHYVVTEWGIAYLYGKSVRERVLQMINIAHPDFREELLEHAKKWNYVYSDQKLPKSIEGRISIYPFQYETNFKLENNEKILIRPVKPTDERMLQELHYSLDENDRYYRFFSIVQDFRHKKIQPLVNIDYSTNMILVGVHSEDSEQKIVALGAVFSTAQPSLGELAFITDKEWRGMGISKFLLDYLVKIAREMNYKKLGGSILTENKAMLHIIDSAGYDLILKKMESGVFEFQIDITKETRKEEKAPFREN